MKRSTLFLSGMLLVAIFFSGCNGVVDLFFPVVVSQSEKATEKKQRTDIISVEDGQVLYTISSKEDITAFITNLRMSEWEYNVTVPEGALELYRIVNWQEPTQTVLNPPEPGTMNVMSTETLYLHDGSYYLYNRTNLMHSAFATKIPDDVGAYLIDLASEGSDQ